MTPDDLTAAAAHADEAATALAHIARHGGIGGMTYIMRSAEDVPGLLARIEGMERAETGIISERDRNEEWADRLAAATAKHFGVDIGEHSNVNDPWANALEAFTDAVDPHVEVEAQTREIGRLARAVAERDNRIARALALHRPFAHPAGYTACAECVRAGDATEYPCPTVRALTEYAADASTVPGTSGEGQA